MLGVGLEVKILDTVYRVQVLVSSCAQVHISTTTHLKPFICGPWIPWRVCFHSMIPDFRVHAGGGAGGKKLGHCLPCASFSFKFCLCSYLNNHSSETFHIWYMDTLEGLLSFYVDFEVPIGPGAPCRGFL